MSTSFYREVLIGILSPFCLMFMMQLLVTMRLFCKGVFFIDRDKLSCTFNIIVWFLMPEIWKLLFDSLTCFKIDGSNRLLADLEIICWEG